MSRIISAAELVKFAERHAPEANSNPALRALHDHDVEPRRRHVWYLATPYTAPTADARARRAELAARMTASLLVAGLNVFSPIAAHHPVSEFMQAHEAPDHAGWMQICYGMLDRCDGLIVSTMDGWLESKGVQREIKRWKALRGDMRDVVYASPITENQPWQPRFAWSPHDVAGL